MKNLYPTFFLIFLSFCAYAQGVKEIAQADTTEIITFNSNGYNSRLTKPAETIEYANKALKLAQKIGYTRGIAEAYRVKGIGEYYLNKFDVAISDYFDAKSYYEKLNDQSGIAKVDNNIGNLYKGVDYEKALDYFNKAEVIAEATHNDQLIASVNLNIGNVYYNKNSFNQALKYYTLSHQQFLKLNNKVLLVQCLQDLGAIYIKLNQTDTAKKILLEANKAAKAQDLNSSVALIDLALTDMFKREGNFVEAEKYLKEGLLSAQLVTNVKYLYDYDKTAYELAFAERNYQKAITYLQKLFDQDSVTYHSNIKIQTILASKEQQHQTERALALKDSAIASQRFWLLAIVAGLLLIVIGLLTGIVKRKATTNAKLKELNNEVSRQKDNLDRINHHLEEIIDERTRDLQVKNKKLSEYSSYLSHQIRGPIATIKGLMNLEKEGLIDQAECINMMDKCVSEIDEKIIEMSDMLHDPGKSGF